MPLKLGRDSKGPYYRWDDGAKYYYTARDPASRERAKKRAIKQAVAVTYEEQREHGGKRKAPEL